MGAQIAAHFANAGCPGAAARRDGRGRGAGPPARPNPQTRSVLHAGHLEARHHGRLRRGLPAAWRRRLDPRSGRRAARRQARPARRRSTRRGARVRSSARTPPGFRSPRSPRIAATTSGSTGSAPTSSTRRATCACSRSFRLPTPTRRSSSTVAWFADHRLGKGVVIAKDSPNFIGNHLALLRRHRDPREGGGRRVHDRGGRRDHRPGARAAEERDVPHARPRRPRHPRPRRPQPARAADRREGARGVRAAAVRRADARARPHRREGRPGLLQAGEGGCRRVRDPDARSGDARVPAPAAARSCPLSKRPNRSADVARADQDAVQRQGPGRPVPAPDAGAAARLRGTGHARRSPTPRTTSTG